MTDEDGFTLVELLTALAAGALLLALLGSLTGSFGLQLQQAGKSNTFSSISDASSLLDRLLQGAEPGPGRDQAVVSDGDHLTTYIDPPLARRGSGQMQLDLDVMRNGDGKALDLTLTSLSSGMRDRRTLVRGMDDIRIDVERDEADPARRLPVLVTIAFTDRDRQTWTLAVEPRLTGSAGCRFDPISLSCRS